MSFSQVFKIAGSLFFRPPGSYNNVFVMGVQNPPGVIAGSFFVPPVLITMFFARVFKTAPGSSEAGEAF